MSKKSFDISVKQVEKIENNVVGKTINTSDGKQKYSFKVPLHSKLVLDFKGKDISNVILNTIRRVCFDDIPTYAFPSELISITDNTTIFDNDMMKNRLSQLPILNTQLDLYYLDQSFWKNIDYSDKKRTKHEKERLIEIQLNVTNDTQNIKNVTTNDIRYYEDGTEVFGKYHKDAPVLLVQLKPADSFKCTMRAALGIGELNDIWASASMVFYDDHTTDDIKGGFVEQKEPHITFTIESQGMMDEYMLLIKACLYIQKKLSDIKSEIDKRVKSKEIVDGSSIVFDLVNEDHTIGALINWAFQSHQNILFSGVAKPDHLLKMIRLKVYTDKKSPIPFMFEQIDMLIDLYKQLEIDISKLSGLKFDSAKADKTNKSESTKKTNKK
jgi:DNA-directed RNA polymerase subunit L